jgi:hypothetical protein
MNLNTIAEVKRPASANQITQWRDGYAWLAGGTWLFSEPQVATDTLIDLDQLNWPALKTSPAGLDIAATRIAELYRLRADRPLRPNPSLKPFAGFGFVGEDRVLEIGSHGREPSASTI